MNLKNFKIILLNIVLQLALYCGIELISSLSYDLWLSIFLLLIIVSMVTNISVIKYVYKEFLSFPMLFILLSYLFHFGQLPLMALDIDMEYYVYLSDRLSKILLRESWEFSFLIINIVVIGIVGFKVFIFNEKDDSYSKEDIEFNNLNYYKILGIVFLMIGVFPKFYIDIEKIKALLAGGYLAIYSTDIPSGFYILSNFLFIGYIVLLFAYKNNINKAKLILVFAILTYVFGMLSGGRAEAAVSIIILIIVYVKYVDSLKLSTVAIIYLVAVIVTTVTNFRQLPDATLTDFFDVIDLTSIFSPIIAIFVEFGGTQLSVALALKNFPLYTDLHIAENYFYGIISFIPGIYNVLEYALTDIAYITKFSNHEGMYLGGSYIGELHYGLDNFAYIGALIVGLIIAIFNNYHTYLLRKSLINYIYLLVLVGNFLWWIRDYSNIILQDFLLLLILAKIVEYTLRFFIIKRR